MGSEVFDRQVLKRCEGKDVVFIFLSLPDEVDTQSTITLLLEHGKTVVVPRIEGENITPLIYTPRLVKGRFGIPEPRERKTIAKEQVDIFFVPGTAFTKEGKRKGRGKGYFDRFLADVKGKKPIIGLCRAKNIVSNLTSHSWDVPVDDLIIDDSVTQIATLASQRSTYHRRRELS